MSLTTKPTIKDVAKLANVSTATVSRFLNGHNLGEERKIRVEQAIRELKFSPSHAASNVRSGKKDSIGVLVSSFLQDANRFLLEKLIFNMMLTLKRKKRKAILELQCANELEVPKFFSNNIDGAILLGKFSDGFIHELASTTAVPLVSLDEPLECPKCDTVSLSTNEAIKNAVTHLIAMGHEQIALIGNAHSNSDKTKIQSFVQAHKILQRPLSDNSIVLLNSNDMPDIMQSLETKIEDVLNTQNPSAIMFTSDYWATLGMSYLQSKGFSIPNQISVIGFGDTSASQCLYPKLSTIGFDYQYLTSNLAWALDDLIDAKKMEPKPINAYFIPRNSISSGPYIRK